MEEVIAVKCTRKGEVKGVDVLIVFEKEPDKKPVSVQMSMNGKGENTFYSNANYNVTNKNLSLFVSDLQFASVACEIATSQANSIIEEFN